MGVLIYEINHKRKINIVKEHKIDGVPLHELARKYDYHVANIKCFCRLCEKHGEKAFENQGTRRNYTREIKLKAIDRVLNGKESTSIVAIDLMLTDSKIVKDWVKNIKNMAKNQ